MARPESVAVGGFFASPPHLVPLILGHLTVGEGSSLNIVDPCAGEGAAIYAIYEGLGKGPTVYTCEMEATRFAKLHERARSIDWASSTKALHGDCFLIEIRKSWAGLLFLNPPYDIDPVHGRLEQRFLDRFTPVLGDGGVLVFIVPFAALEASATTLATEYENLSCYRFPKDDFATFKQVVLFAQKADRRLAPDPKILTQVRAWSKSVKACPVLGTAADPYTLGGSGYNSEWKLRDVDIQALISKVRPWKQTRAVGDLTAVPHILPEVPIEDLLFRTFRVATAPRPAHIAAGIASGLFNGREVSSKTPGMARLLVKGVFDRDYVTIEEKTDKTGVVTSVTQVQQPRLVTTVLNLETKKYSTLAPVGSKGQGMTIEDLLEHYGPSLMNVMNLQCPVSYDPKRDAKGLPLLPVARPLYDAHEHVTKALLQLFGGADAKPSERRGKAAILLGEIGSGKTSCALALGQTIGRRLLALCPPHLLTGWTNEVRSVLPDAEIRVLDSMQDVDDLLEVPADRMLIAILSRETAKLGHGWEAVSGPGCPKCGALLPTGDLAKKRVCCPSTAIQFADNFARAAFTLTLRLAPALPDNAHVVALLNGRRHLTRWLTKLETVKKRPKWPGFDSEWVTLTLADTLQRVLKSNSEDAIKLMGRLLLADYQPERIASLARTFSSRVDYYMDDLARELTMLLPPGKLQDEVKSITFAKAHSYATFESYNKTLAQGMTGKLGKLQLSEGVLTLDGRKPGSVELAASILAKLGVVGSFPRAAECGEPLYQAAPGATRFPLAEYIARRHPRMFDFLVLDEGHEYQNGDTAQSHAAHRLSGLGLPTLLMTGSIMNGYAASLFTNLWALSPAFRAEFGRDELQRYLDRYGYRKRVLTDKDRETGEVVAFGSHTDRVERSERVTGNAPGILPIFLFRHLLAFSVTLQKADLALDLPQCRHIKKEIEPSPKLLANYTKLLNGLIAQIKKDQFSEELSGKLFGALSELPSYLDRATLDTGNQEDGSYGIYYPESVGGDLVVAANSFSAKTILPKEQWMLDTVRAEIAEGRNVMVFCWHVNLLPRLARLLENEFGLKVPVLEADKVPTAKREAWIDKNVVAKRARMMVANPVGIQTGLNNLRYFATEVWMENPAVNPTIYRQAIGRVDRIGQLLETRIYTPIYAKTLQVQLHQLLLRKVAVSIAADGLDSESALLAAGAGEDALLTGLSIGRQLWAMLSELN